MKWIPIGEALPKSRGEYLVTINFDGDTYVECFHYGKPLMANREVKGECFYDSDDEWGDVVYDKEVIAWMPLPKPYRKTEPKTERVETMSCQECKWWFTDSLKHGGYCQSLLYNHECRYEPEVDCSWK